MDMDMLKELLKNTFVKIFQNPSYPGSVTKQFEFPEKIQVNYIQQ